MFKWPITLLFALSNLCFFTLMMSLEETLSAITKRELSLTLSSYSCQSKFVRKALKVHSQARDNFWQLKAL